MTTPDPSGSPLGSERPNGVWMHPDGSRVEIVQSGLWWSAYVYKRPEDTRPDPDGTQEFHAEEQVRDLISTLQSQGFARDPHRQAGVPPQYPEAKGWFGRIRDFWRS